MATPLEIYRAWEREAPKTVVHVMQIDRGDGSPGNRLTLTDKAYYDKGVNGTKYHQTYPAPIQAIISEIVTDEQLDGTRFSDIVLANGDGKFDGLLSGPNILGESFVMLRGDTRWSVTEIAFPYRFVEIFRGQIDDVIVDRDRVRLKIVPVSHDLEIPAATNDEPLAAGTAWNIPLILEDSANSRYRFSSRFILSDDDDALVVMDSGVELANPGEMSPDYTLVTESGEFRGLIEFTGGDPARPTAALKAEVYDYDPFLLASRVLSEIGGLGPQGLEDGSIPLSSFVSGINGVSHSITPDGTKYFRVISPDLGTKLIYQYSLSSDDIINSFSYDSVVASLDTPFGSFTSFINAHCFSHDGMVLLVTGVSNISQSTIARYTMPFPYDLENLTYDDQLDIDDTLGYPHFSPDGMTLIGIYNNELVAYALSEQNGLPDDIDDPAQTMDISRVITIPDPSDAQYEFSMHIPWHGTEIFFLAHASGDMKRIDLFDAWDLSGYVYSKDAIRLLPRNLGARMILFHPDGKKFYCQSGEFYQFSLDTAFMLPKALVDYVSLYDPRDYRSGIHTSSAQMGRVVTDLVSATGAGWSVDRNGVISAVVVSSPDADYSGLARSGPTYHQLNFGHLLGNRNTAVRMVSTIPEITNFIVRYAPNFSPFQGSDVGGSVDVDFKEALIRGDFELVDESTPPGQREPNTGTFNTFYASLGTSADATPFDATPTAALADYQETWGVDRYLYDVECVLWATPLSSNCYLGDIFTLDFDGPGFTAGTKFQLHGRRVNWTRNTQTLRLFK